MTSERGRREGERLRVRTYRGGESTPWQFSLRRTADEIILTQARGPEDEFDPVEKRYAIEPKPVGDEPVEFRQAVSRRVWSEDPEQPEVRSQRSEGRKVLFLYRDGGGWHVDEPDPVASDPPHDTGAEFEPTALPGVAVSTTYLRAEEGEDVRFTEERVYRVTDEVLDEYGETYVLACDEVNEESVERAVWEVDDAVAHRLVAA